MSGYNITISGELNTTNLILSSTNGSITSDLDTNLSLPSTTTLASASASVPASTPTTAPVAAPETNITYEAITSPSQVKVIPSDGNKYVFNNDSSYNENKRSK